MIALTGHYRALQFSQPLISEAVRILGWANICTSETMAADRARFFETYENLRKAAWKEAVVTPRLA